jgi:hypothetical protein
MMGPAVKDPSPPQYQAGILARLWRGTYAALAARWPSSRYDPRNAAATFPGRRSTIGVWSDIRSCRDSFQEHLR